MCQTLAECGPQDMSLHVVQAETLAHLAARSRLEPWCTARRLDWKQTRSERAESELARFAAGRDMLVYGWRCGRAAGLEEAGLGPTHRFGNEQQQGSVATPLAAPHPQDALDSTTDCPPPLPWLPKTTRSHPDTIPKQWPTEPIPDLAVLHGAWAVKPLDKWRRVRRPSPLRALCLFLCFRGACRLSRPTMQRWPKRIDGQHKLAPMFFACAFIQGGSLGQGRAGISRI